MANPSAGNYTGKQKKKLEAKAREEQTLRANELSMVTAEAEQEKKDAVVDYTKKGGVKEVEITTEAGEQHPTDEAGDESTAEQQPASDVEEVAPIEVGKSKIRVRARADLDQVTVGKGNHYDFEAGRQYFVPPNVARHLGERELVDILG